MKIFHISMSIRFKKLIYLQLDRYSFDYIFCVAHNYRSKYFFVLDGLQKTYPAQLKIQDKTNPLVIRWYWCGKRLSVRWVKNTILDIEGYYVTSIINWSSINTFIVFFSTLKKKLKLTVKLSTVILSKLISCKIPHLRNRAKVIIMAYICI